MSDPNKPRPSASSTVSQTVTEEPKEAEAQPVLKLRLKKPPSSRRVQWAEDTVDNEHMDKKKSKCCCIYKKPLDFGESDSESSDDDDDDDDCQHCSHHKKNDYVAARDGQTQDKTEETTTEAEEEAKANSASASEQRPKPQRKHSFDCPLSKVAETEEEAEAASASVSFSHNPRPKPRRKHSFDCPFSEVEEQKDDDSITNPPEDEDEAPSSSGGQSDKGSRDEASRDEGSRDEGSRDEGSRDEGSTEADERDATTNSSGHPPMSFCSAYTVKAQRTDGSATSEAGSQEVTRNTNENSAVGRRNEDHRPSQLRNEEETSDPVDFRRRDTRKNTVTNSITRFKKLSFAGDWK